MKIILFIIVLVVLILVFSLFFGKKGERSDSSPLQIENKLVAAAKAYANNKKNNKILPTKENESNKIKSELLQERGYLKELKYNNQKCSGYVDLIYKNKEVLYIPYVTCGSLYNTRKIGSYILDNEPVVTTNDGLYKMGEKYVFRGETVNNYIMIGDVMYRIIEITEDKELRLISNKKAGIGFNWDDRYNTEKRNYTGINDYKKSRLKEKIDYIVKNNDFTDENSSDYYLTKEEYRKMIPHDACIGKRALSNGVIDSSNECQTVSENEYISLLTVSDYARASIDPNCKSIYDQSCVNYNYLSGINDVFYTITAVSDNSYEIFTISGGVATDVKSSRSFTPNIVIYIGNDSIYLSGDGSIKKPYILKESNV